MLRVRDIKAYARETLLDRYGTVIGATILSRLFVFLCGTVSVVFMALSLGNTHKFEDMIRKALPGFNAAPGLSVFFAVLFVLLLIFTFFFKVWLTIGRNKLMLNICRGERSSAADIFYAFREGSHPWKILILNVVEYVLVEINTAFPLILRAIAKANGYQYADAPRFDGPWGTAIIIVSILAILWMLWLALGFVFADLIIVDDPGTGVMEALKESLRLTRHRKLKFFWLLLSFLFWGILTMFVKVAALWILPYVEASIVIFYLSARGENDAVCGFLCMNGQETAAEEPAAKETEKEEQPVFSAELPPDPAPEEEILISGSELAPVPETEDAGKTEPDTRGWPLTGAGTAAETVPESTGDNT